MTQVFILLDHGMISVAILIIILARATVILKLETIGGSWSALLSLVGRKPKKVLLILRENFGLRVSSEAQAREHFMLGYSRTLGLWQFTRPKETGFRKPKDSASERRNVSKFNVKLWS